jgi:hypothetical protein
MAAALALVRAHQSYGLYVVQHRRLAMQMALRVKTRVLAGGRIEVDAPELEPGAAVELIILLPEATTGELRSAVDILSEMSGQRAFKTAAEIDAYVREERDAWDR